MKEFNWECLWVFLENRWEEDNHICVWIQVEDDWYWHKKDSFSSHWLDELIDSLISARKYIKKQKKDIWNDWKQYWYTFK